MMTFYTFCVLGEKKTKANRNKLLTDKIISKTDLNHIRHNIQAFTGFNINSSSIVRQLLQKLSNY